MSYSKLWVDKYLPTNSSEIIGNKKEIKWIKKWLDHFEGKDTFPNFKNGILLSGKPGIGKTTMAHIILKEAGYDILEFNASEVRSQKIIRSKLSSVINGSNILQMVNKINKTAIIMDEVDGTSSGEKGVIKELVSYIDNAEKYSMEISKKKNKKKKIRKKKNSYPVNRTPIICLCNNIVNGMKGLKNACIHIKVSVPSDEDIFQLIKKIKINENIRMNDTVCRLIVPHCQMDLRRTINILENIKLYFNNNEIKPSDISKIIKSFGNKDIDVGLYTAINNIFDTKLSIDNSLINYQADKVFVPMLVHENIDKQVRLNYNNTDIEKLDALYEYYDYITNGNIVENEVFSNHNWQLNDYVGIMSCYSANYIINKLNKSKFQKYSTINSSPVLSKINYKFYNLKIANMICKKLDIDTNNFQIFTKYIYDTFIFDTYSSIIKNRIIKYLSDHLDFENIDKCVKLSYLYPENKKLYSNKLKKKIKNIFDK